MNYARFIHAHMGLSVLPSIMASQLGALVKKVVVVSIKHDIVGVLYIDDLDNVFTLSSKIYGKESNVVRKVEHALTYPESYLEFIVDGKVSYYDSDVHAEVLNINDAFLKTIPSLKEKYNDINPTSDFKTIISTFDELESRINDAINNLIENNNWSKPLSINDRYASNIKALQLLSHYMFAIKGQRFFMTNANSDWYNQLLSNKKPLSKYISSEELNDLIKAVSQISDVNQPKNDLIDSIAASLVLKNWDRLFKSTVFQAEDGSFKLISAEAEKISVLPASQTTKLTNQQNTGKLIITTAKKS